MDAHRESTFFVQPGFDDVILDLRQQACLAGADAITDVAESKGGYVEMSSYHVTATAIVYQ